MKYKSIIMKTMACLLMFATFGINLPTNIGATTNVIEVDGTTKTLQAAFNDAQDGDTIKIVNDLNLYSVESSTPADAKNLTIDLNGMLLEGYASDWKNGIIKHNGTGTVTIKDSTADKLGEIRFTGSTAGAAVINETTGTVTLESGVLNNAGRGTVIRSENHGNVNVNGGIVKTSDNMGIAIDYGTLNVKGGHLIATEDATLINSFYAADINIDGATLSVEDSQAIFMRRGKLNVSESNPSKPTKISNRGNSETTSTIAIGHPNLDELAEFTISGGTIENTGIGTAIDGAKVRGIVKGTANITCSIANDESGTISIEDTQYFFDDNSMPGYILDVQGGTISNAIDKYAVYLGDDITEDNVRNYYAQAAGAKVGKVHPKAKELPEYTGKQSVAPDASKVIKTETGITLDKQTIANEMVEYGYSTTNTVPTSWQDNHVFSGLKSNTEYYFFSRVKANTTHKAGKVSSGTKIKTAMSATDKLDVAKSLAEEVIKNTTCTNKTTDQFILESVNTSIASVDGVTATWKTTPTIIRATKENAGSIKGIIVLTTGDKTVEIIVDKTIAKLVPKESIEDEKTGVKVEYENGKLFEPEIELVVTPKTEKEMKVLQAGVEKVAKGLTLGGVYDIKLLKDGVEIQPDGKVKITLPLTAKMKEMSNLQVVYIDDAGNVTIIPSQLVDGKLVFITDHFSYYGVIGKEKPKETIQTGDVSNPTLYLGLILLSGCVAILGIKEKKH